MRRLLWLALIGVLVPLSALAQTAVRTVALSELLIYPEQSAPASVKSLNDSRLSAELVARIESIKVRVGDRVEQGDLLVMLDCRQYRAALQARNSAIAEVDAQIALAESQLERAQRLRQQRNISEQEVDQRRTELRVFSARRVSLIQQRVQAELEVDRCRVVAPFAGVIRERLAQLGELAAPGNELVRLQQTDRVELVAHIEAGEKLDQAVGLAFEYQGQRLTVRVYRVLPVIDSRARTREVRLEFGGDMAPPGSAGRLIWRTADGHLPGHLLLRREGVLGVMVDDQGQARFVPLPNAIEGQPARIELPPASRVVVEGRHGLVAGDALEIRP